MIQLDDEYYWLYAVVGTDSNKLLHTKLEPARINVITQALFRELRKKHRVDDAVFLIDGASPLNNACRRQGLDFGCERHKHRNSVDRVFRAIKRRTEWVSTCFSHAEAETADSWLRSFAFAWDQFI